MELRQLRQFVAVAETQSFSMAALRLSMAQPPLSVAIRKLEQEIGTPLFERGSRGVKLTPAGEMALGAAVRCIEASRELVLLARGGADGLSGLLRIGFIGSMNQSLLPKLIRAFTKDSPNIRLELTESTNHGLLKDLQEDGVHAAFIREPTTRPPGILFRPVATDSFWAALPLGHPLCERDPLSLSDLRDQDFIGYAPSRVGGLGAAVTQVLSERGVAVRVTQEAVQVQTVLALVRSGLGVALIPSINVSHALSDVVFRPIADLAQTSRIGIALAYKADGENLALKRFVASVELSQRNPDLTAG